MPLGVTGTSNHLLVVHRLRRPRDRHPWTILHKVTDRTSEPLIHAWVTGQDERLLPRLHVPALLEQVEVGGRVHLFMDYLAWFEPTPPPSSVRGYEVLASAIARLNLLSTHGPGPGAGVDRTDYSLGALDATMEAVLASPLLDEVGAPGRQALAALARNTVGVAEVTADVTRVLAHNDAAAHNLMVHGDGNDGPAVVTLLDWGQAGWNLPGSDLHHLVRSGSASPSLFERCLRVYSAETGPRLGFGTGGEWWRFVALGAYLYAFLRLQAMARTRGDPGRLARALRIGEWVVAVLEGLGGDGRRRDTAGTRDALGTLPGRLRYGVSHTAG